jgi:hypothetical protein
MNEHPKFHEGQEVEFNYDGVVKGWGHIRGLASQGVIDVWIVEVKEVQNLNKEVYPWSCIAVSHPSLKSRHVKED